MTFKVRDEQDASDLFAYLVSIGPEIPEDQQGALTGEAAAGG